MMDQFMRPFVADGSAFERTFGVEPTPLDVGLARTVAWYRTRSGGGASA
jgi:nucleoside-diphosphate-sugar epimerase